MGDNISEKNREYCELTVQYYVWKNVASDYYGFCHYRRFFGFGKKLRLPYAAFGKISEKHKKYIGSAEDAEKIIFENDITVPRPENLGMPVRKYYGLAKNHYEEDLELFLQVLSEKYPKMMPYAEKYLSQNYQYFCNMFVMKKEYFHEYCEVLFSVLEEFDRRKTLHGNFQSDRTDGYLGERFVGIYILYALECGARVGEVARIDVNCPLKKRIIYNLFPPESGIRFLFKRFKGIFDK